MKPWTCSWILVAAGCSAGAKPQPATPGPTAPTTADPAVPAASVVCYSGNGAVSLPDGKVVETFQAVARRALDPATRTITERVAIGGSRPDHYAVTIHVDGAKLAMTEDGGAFTGDGELTAGDPWRWTAWTTRSTLPDGTVVTSTDTVDGERLTAAKTVVSPAGELVVTIGETFTEVACADYEARAAALVRAEP